MKRFCTILFFCWFTSLIFAIDVLRINTITDREGLSQNTVRCLMEDSKGFIWMGTINGLNRYNGKDFMLVKPQSEEPETLSDSRIRSIHEDKHGYIWVRTFSSTMFCYDPRQEQFVDYALNNELHTFTGIKIVSNGDVWLWGTQGCLRVRHTGNNLLSWNPIPLEKAKAVSFVFEDTQGNIWIGNQDELYLQRDEQIISTWKGKHYAAAHEWNNQLFFVANDHIAVFDQQQQAFLSDVTFTATQPMYYSRTCMLNDGVILIAGKDEIFSFHAQDKMIMTAAPLFQGRKFKNANFLLDNRGDVWVYNMSGTLWQHRSDNRFEPMKLIPEDVLSLINNERYQIYHDSRDVVWITTFGNGLFAFDQSTGMLRHFSTEKDLATNYLLSVTEDRSGEIWVGTELAGAIKISLTTYPFDIFYPNPKGDSDRDNAVRLIYEDQNNSFWFGTRDGNLHICDSTLQLKYKHRLATGLPLTIAEDTLGNKWLGTKGGGVYLFSPTGSRVLAKYQLNDRIEQSSSSSNAFTILRDGNNRMWVASFGGGLHLAQQHNGEITFKQILFPHVHHNMMRSMIQDNNGTIWVGTNEGIVVFNPDEILLDERAYTILFLQTKQHESLDNNEVRSLFEDNQGRIWIGTSGGGLHLLVKEEPLENSWVKHYTAVHGLSNEMIQAIQEDEHGIIWVSTESGISKFYPETENFENFVFSNNRHAAIFNELSFWKKRNGDLMFGSYNGVYTFNPLEVAYDSYAPPVLITALGINGIHVTPNDADSPLIESITNTKQLHLKYNQNAFNLECTMLNFHAPELNKYAYYLEGYEKNWNAISRNNIAAYRNVPAGTYTFRVKGCNSFGVWSKNETTLLIVISPPWWKSGWAILSYFFIAIIVTIVTFRLVLKMNRLNTAVEVEKQLTEYKLRFFTNISHEFRTPLTIIRGAIESMVAQKDLSLSEHEQLKTLHKSSNRLLRLIEQLLEFRKLQNDKMELKLETTNTEVFFREIHQTFKEMAEKKQIDFLFETDDYTQPVLIDHGKMDKIVYNLLSNAFKHTPQGGTIRLSLHTSVEDDKFTIRVADSGVGVVPEQRDKLFVRFQQISYTVGGTGVGLHLTSELVKVHKGSVGYEDTDLGGACFYVSIPLSANNYEQTDILSDTISTNTAFMKDIITNPEKESLKPIVDSAAKSTKVMVVEDDDEVRTFLETQLSAYFTVSSVSDGFEALKELVVEHPDIVVCDVMMPRMDGFEFTRRLKTNFETSHIPVVLLTAFSSEEHQLEGIQAGADSYITKPFSIKYLLTRIVKLLEIRERLRHRFNTEPGLIQASVSFTDRDQVFMDSLHKIVEENLNNADFKVETFAQTLGMGRTTFFRKLKGITGYAPNEYVRIIRMKKAAELLMGTDLNVSEISYQVGIEDPYYFSKCFKGQFGKSPTQYRKG
ncbi:response regulator [Bacteroides sp. 214]|uniref:two-component regulator propeller domain-containing protein n=1 Tax=Bacteroides sp. 214 TaxID=2302935 RepID=UPI0013D54CC7|nr:two-component regulator propeller domain-containing protein [Bacteroides sp. 214]NDW11478.1 response regulator [Bacteroides sp. 214]